MKTKSMLDRWPDGIAFERPEVTFNDDREIACWVKNTVRGMDPVAPDDSLDFRLTCFMIASSLVGPDHRRIANLLGLPSQRAGQWAENLRRNGVWQTYGR